MISNGEIYLRAPEPDDVDAIFRWENDRESWSSAGVRAPMSRHLILNYINSLSANIFEDGQARFMVCRVEDDAAIGAIDFYDVDSINRRCGVGIVVDKKYRDMGYGATSLRLLCDYAWRDLGLHQLWAIVGAENTPSRQLFESCGFGISGRLKSWIRIGESFVDAYAYQCLLPNQWTTD